MKKNVYWLYLFFTFPSLFSLGVHANANLTANSSSATSIVSDVYFSMVADALLGLAIILAIYFFCRNRRLTRRLEKSRQQEDQLRTLYAAIDQSPASVVIAGLDANIRSVNPSFTEITGYSLHEVMGHNPSVLHSGLTSPDVYNEMWQKLTHGESWSASLLTGGKTGKSIGNRPIFHRYSMMTEKSPSMLR